MSDIKMYYEMAKLTNTSKVITDDFVQRVCLALFNHYLDSLGDNKLTFLARFMDKWEQDIVNQKINELDSLSTNGETLSDLVTGSYIASTENLEDFKAEVDTAKLILFDALSK